VQLVLLGLSHKTTPVELRGRLAWAAGEIPGVLSALCSLPGIEESCLISTCNRTEFYLASEDGVPVLELVLRFWAEAKGVDPEELGPHTYSASDMAVVQHLFRVASGLDSMILGETQILGQVRDAWMLASEHGSLGKYLHALFNQAVACGKRVHSETAISQNAVSVSYAAVELAKKIFGSLKGVTVLIVGAGKMADLTARHLLDSGVREVLVCNRTYERAVELARQYSGRAVPWEDLGRSLGEAEVVISSTGAPGYVITLDLVREAMRHRRYRPLFIVDIAVPQDVEPAAGSVENVFLYNIDDLEQVVLANLEERKREAQKAERIVAEEVRGFQAWFRSQDAVPLIRSLREKAEEIRRKELERLFHRLPGLTDREREIIAGTTALIVNKILNDPTVKVKEFAGGEDGEVYLRAFSLLFNLNPGEKGPEG